ncbi:MAG: SufD family Fe-S cluster assembly protein [Patescibacteria group bacterium]
MEIIDLKKSFNQEINVSGGDKKVFIWRLFGAGNFSGKISLNIGENSSCQNIFLFSAIRDNSHDFSFSVKHAGADSQSNTAIYGIGRGRASVSAFASARILKSAKRSSAWLEGRAFLYENSACRIDPRLEVETNDVLKAGHAATVSRISDEDIFYMATRGVGESEAIKLKNRGFLTAPLLRAGLNFEETEKIIEPILNYV